MFLCRTCNIRKRGMADTAIVYSSDLVGNAIIVDADALPLKALKPLFAVDGGTHILSGDRNSNGGVRTAA